MFRNGIFEDGWRKKGEEVGMEVRQGFDEVQDLGNGAEKWRGWLDLFKERKSNVAQQYGNLGQSEQMENVRQGF